jgi:hypothetical protein
MKHDLFIAHASEDKAEVVRPLVQSLASLGLRVWYDEDTGNEAVGFRPPLLPGRSAQREYLA